MSFSNINNALKEILQTDEYLEVCNLPWSDSALGHDGFYSGSVNGNIEPHGHGTWICSGSCSAKSHRLSGNWYNRCFITNDWMDYIIEMAHDEKQNRGRGRSRFRDDGTKKRVAFQSRPSIIGRNHHSCSQSEGMPVYHLGEVLRSQDHAMASGPKNTEMAKMLEEHDCAFIKRSDSGWTYSILAYRISPTFGEHDCDLHCDGDVLDDDFNKQNVDTNEEVMLFVLDKMGRTKAIRSSSYGKYIRCVTEMPDKNIEVKEAEPNGKSSFVDSPSAFQEIASPRRTFAARGA